MFHQKKIAFIGPGVMAEAMIAGLLRHQIILPQAILAAGPGTQRLEELQQNYGVQTFTENAQAASQADVVVLSIKPQRLDKVLSELCGTVRPDALVLSIVAGAPIEKMSSALQHDRIVRAMPNTPARIGEGITVWTASENVLPAMHEQAKQILSALGEEVFMKEERYLDMATALSGTGPAYVFLFMEAMVDAGVHLGFPRRVAEKLVAHTVRGSVDFYLQSEQPLHLASLRNQVTSPAGTTASALYFLEKAGFRTAISRAVWAAYERSQALGSSGKSSPPEKNG